MSAYDHDAVPKRARRRTGGPCDAERAYWPKFTLEEVARHKSLKDGWIVVHERVFDITTFAITHPGFHNAGQVSTALAITRNLGEDCTDDSAHASEDLRPSSRQLELRREQRPTARETDARFRLNHEPSCESPPVA